MYFFIYVCIVCTYKYIQKCSWTNIEFMYMYVYMYMYISYIIYSCTYMPVYIHICICTYAKSQVQGESGST